MKKNNISTSKYLMLYFGRSQFCDSQNSSGFLFQSFFAFSSKRIFTSILNAKKLSLKFLCLSLIMIFFSCKNEKLNNQDNKYEIIGTIKNIENPNFFYILEKDEKSQEIKTIDSIKINNNSFNLKSNTTEPDYIFAKIDDSEIFSIFVEPGKINVIIEKNIEDEIEITASGTITNNSILKYKKQINPFIQQIKDIQNSVSESQTNADKISEIENQINEIKLKIQNHENNYIKNNKKDFLSLLLIESKIVNQTDTKEIKNLLDQLDKSIKNTKFAKKLSGKINNILQTEIGSKAPNFELINQQEKIISLEKSLGKKVTILDFWASWCGPCRQENPNLIKLYNTYKSKGLEIISISLDQDKNAWKQAIIQDKLTWNNVIDSFDGKLASSYQINYIPFTVVLDKKGQIISKNLRGEELYLIVEKLIFNN